MKEMSTRILTIIFIVLIVSSVPAASARLVGTGYLRENVKVEKNESTKELISEFEKTLSELNKISSTADEALVAEYVKQELQKLRQEVEQLDVNQGVKKSLLVKVDAASEKNDKVLQFALEGKENQADNMLKSVINILNAFINEIEAQSRNKIATDDTKNLIQHTNEIIKGIEEGAQWIINENPDLEFTQESEFFAKIENKVIKLGEIITEIQARGVEVDVVLEGEVGIRALPAVVIVIAGVRYMLFPATIGALTAYAKIRITEESLGPICSECEIKIYAIEITSSILGGVVTKLIFLKLGLQLIGVEEACSELGGSGINELFEELMNLTGGCDDPNCVFYKYKPDLLPTIDAPGSMHVNKTCAINTTLYNNGNGNAGPFKVTLYVNNTPVKTWPQFNFTDYYTGNYTPIETKTVPELAVKDHITLQFDWKPTSVGSYVLKVSSDPSNEVRELNEKNNDVFAQVIVYPPGYVECTLYNTKLVPSSSDPTQLLYMVWYYKTDRPVLLSPGMRTPTFIYHTTQPVYSPTGFQVFYPYGAIWQFYGDSEDGPWHPCWFNPYVVCQPNITEYSVKHWAMGSGYYQYFAVKMTTGAGPWPSPILKTFLEDFEIRENV